MTRWHDLESVDERLRQVCTAAAVLLEWKAESHGSAWSAFLVGRDFRQLLLHPLRHLVLGAVVSQMLSVGMFRLD